MVLLLCVDLPLEVSPNQPQNPILRLRGDY